MKCERVDQFPDMGPGTYVMVDCSTEAAVLWWEGAGPYSPEPSTHVLCATHATEQMAYCHAEGTPFKVRSLDDDDRKEYDAGHELGATCALTDEQCYIAAHVGYGELDLSTPENSTELFDLGWAAALDRQVEAWYLREEKDTAQ